LNLAVYYAKSGIRVGLLDADPLSNLITIIGGDLDVEYKRHEGIPVYPAFKNMDILFPGQKIEKENRDEIRDLLTGPQASDALKEYDLILFDLPAGIHTDENILFLPFAGSLLIVVNTEPTSHVSAGGFLKAALEINPDLQLFLWHNRFQEVSEAGFDARDIVGNYNRFVPFEIRINEDIRDDISHIAFVPRDASLDLLMGDFSPLGTALEKMVNISRALYEGMIAESFKGLDEDKADSSPFLNLLRYYLCRNPFNTEVEDYVEEASAYITGFLDEKNGIKTGWKDVVKNIVVQVHAIKGRKAVADLLSALDEAIETQAASGGPFSAAAGAGLDRKMQVRVLAVLDLLSKTEIPDQYIQNCGSILYFYYSSYLLLSHETVQLLIRNFLPRYTPQSGRGERDRKRQIRHLVEADGEYHQKFYTLVKKLYPVALKQLTGLSRSRNYESLILKSGGYAVNQKAYLSLLSDLMHDIVNSGLGIAVGMKFNAASSAIRAGAFELQKRIFEDKAE
jgi:hypothetical protein